MPSREDIEEQDRTIITHDETRRRGSQGSVEWPLRRGSKPQHGCNTRQHWTGECTQGLPLERVTAWLRPKMVIYPQKRTPVVTETPEWALATETPRDHQRQRVSPPIQSYSGQATASAFSVGGSPLQHELLSSQAWSPTDPSGFMDD